jgi:uncharacterized membrane protein (DUF2068 family)
MSEKLKETEARVAKDVRSAERKGSEQEERRGLLGLIAFERAARGLILLALGIYLMTQLHSDWGRTIQHLAGHLGLDPSSSWLDRFVKHAHELNAHHHLLIGAAALFYGVLEFVEGVGLWLRYVWAEWLTVVATGLLIPFEIYELSHKASVLKAGGLVANVLIVLYLIWLIRRRVRRHRKQAADS